MGLSSNSGEEVRKRNRNKPHNNFIIHRLYDFIVFHYFGTQKNQMVGERKEKQLLVISNPSPNCLKLQISIINNRLKFQRHVKILHLAIELKTKLV